MIMITTIVPGKPFGPRCLNCFYLNFFKNFVQNTMANTSSGAIRLMERTVSSLTVSICVNPSGVSRVVLRT